MRAAFFQPVHHHSELREREGQESSHRIERDQFVGDSAKYNEQEAGEERENHDAVRVDEPAAMGCEGVWQVIVLGDGAAESRKIGERGVRGKRKNEENRSDSDVVKNAFAENR